MAPHTKIPARDWPWAINTGTSEAPVWTPIGGLDTWGHKPSSSTADATTFDDHGRDSHFVATRGDEFTLTGKFKEDHTTGDRDPGQAAIEALGQLIGIDSLAQFRVTSPGGTAKTFAASATVTVGGGGGSDASKWEAALKVDGAIASGDPLPELPGAPTAVAGTTDDEMSLVTWTDSGTGDPFAAYEVEARVSGVPVLTITATTPEVAVVAPLTNGTGYTFRVRARNAAGWGPWSTASTTVTPAS